MLIVQPNNIPMSKAAVTKFQIIIISHHRPGGDEINIKFLYTLRKLPETMRQFYGILFYQISGQKSVFKRNFGH